MGMTNGQSTLGGAGWLDLPEVFFPECQMLWIAGYWDGPLSGVADHDGRMVWFETLIDPGFRSRHYGLYELVEAERAELVARHGEWCAEVGPTWDVTYRGRLPRRQFLMERPGAEEAFKTLTPASEAVRTIAARGVPYARICFYPSPHMHRERSVRYWRKVYERTSQGIWS